ncbi:molybdopterin oxidoreductase family protein, partial [Acinetobacter baumannii]
TGFNLEFPKNGFHLRHPVLAAQANTLPEAEIYTRLLEAMNAIPKSFPVLEKIAAVDSKKTAYLPYLSALGITLARHKKYIPFAASIIYRTLGKRLGNSADSV